MDSQRHNETLMKAVAKRFSELRKAKGLSQIEIYRDIGIHIGRIESGYSNITIFVNIIIFHLKNFSIHWMLNDRKSL